MEKYFIILFLIVILLFIIALFNSIKRLHNKVLQSKSGIEVALTKRFDLIPNLVECVKGYMNYEEKVLTEVIEEREKFYQNKDINDGINLNNKCNNLLALSEKYPDLKASNQFIELQAALERTENQVSAARRLYNSDVTLYNTKIQLFPNNIIAKIMKFKTEKLFEADDESKSSVKINK